MGVRKVKNAKNFKLGVLTAFNKKTKYEITQEVDKGYFFYLDRVEQSVWPVMPTACHICLLQAAKEDNI